MSSAIKFDKEQFSREVLGQVEKKQINFIEAVLEICELHEIEPDCVADLLSDPIKQKLRVEGELLNILEKTAQLEV